MRARESAMPLNPQDGEQGDYLLRSSPGHQPRGFSAIDKQVLNMLRPRVLK